MKTELQEITTSQDAPFIGSVQLSDSQINFLLSQFGQFKRNVTILKDFKSTFNREYSQRSLYDFQKRYKNEIKQVRDQWVNSLADEAGSHKRVRVNALWSMYCQLNDHLSEFEQQKEYKEIRLHNKQMESLLNSLRVEMEGNTINVNYRNLNTQKDDELIDTARDVLNKVDPGLIEDANYKILDEKKDK